MESVQHRAIKMIQGFSGMGYQERLQVLNLTTLETRSICGDLIEVFKIFTVFKDIDAKFFFLKFRVKFTWSQVEVWKAYGKIRCEKICFQQQKQSC